MSARLAYIPNPMAPALGGRLLKCLPGMTVSQVLKAYALKPMPTTVLFRDGKPVPRKLWDAVPLNDNEEARLVVLPEGDEGSQIAGVIASLALAVFAPGIGGWLAGSLAEKTVLGIAVKSLTTTAVLVGGQSLISALLPAPKPYAPAVGTSPTYDVAAQSNRARLGDAIADAFGRNMVVCDLISAPYFEFENNVQVVKQLVAVGLGEYDIEAIRLSQAIIWKNGGPTGAYPEIELEVCGPTDPVTLIEDNVATSTEVSAVELKGANEEGAGSVGPFVCSRPGTAPTHLGIDVGFQALIGADEDGHLTTASVSFEVEVQRIGNDGTPSGGWISILSETVTRQTRSPLRISYKPALPSAGRWQARMTRTSDKSTDKNTLDTVQWLAMRAYMPSISDYPRITKIAVKARGTANVNGDALQRLNAICTRKLPVASIDPDTGAISWSAPAATRNPAWAVAHLLRDAALANLPNSRFSVAQLIGLAQTWADRGDWFDGVFDSRKGLWGNIQSILNVGRARAYIAGAQVAFIRDEPRTIPAGVFSPRNMLPGSFKIGYTFNQANSVDALRIQFIDNRTWTQNEVLCAPPGWDGDPEDVPVMQWFGITDRDHAWREGMFLVYQNIYRGIAPSFKTALEGRACFPGSMVRVGHWLAKWGKAAKVLRLTQKEDGDELLLSEPWSIPEGKESEARLVTLTSPDGREYGPVTFDLLDDGASTRKAIIKLTDMAVMAVGKYAGQHPRDWPQLRSVNRDTRLEMPRVILGTATEQPIATLVTEMSPDAGGKTASLSTVVDDPRVYTADEGDPPEEVGGPDSTDTDDLVITALGLDESAGSGDVVNVAVAVEGAADAVSFDVHWKRVSGSFFNPVARDQEREFDLQVSTGTAGIGTPVTIEVRACGPRGDYGPWFPITFFADGVNDVTPSDVGTVSTNGSPTGATISLEVNNYTWAAVSGATSYMIEVWSRKNGSGDWVKRREAETMTNTYTRYPADEIDEGGPWHDTYIQIKAVNSAGISAHWSQSDDGT
jgi:hypothetical protein